MANDPQAIYFTGSLIAAMLTLAVYTLMHNIREKIKLPNFTLFWLPIASFIFCFSFIITLISVILEYYNFMLFNSSFFFISSLIFFSGATIILISIIPLIEFGIAQAEKNKEKRKDLKRMDKELLEKMYGHA